MTAPHPLDWPFDAADLLRRKRALRRELLQGGPFLDKRIAILGGSTTAEVRDQLELFLLRRGIRPAFYESEYAQFEQDLRFAAPALTAFKPDLVYLHTSVVNIGPWPDLGQDPAEVDALAAAALARFAALWDRAEADLRCPVIQNNFEDPWDRPLGNLDAWDHRGRTHYVDRLNLAFAAEARRRPALYLQDLRHLAARRGLERWHDRNAWYLYKYALALDAIPELAHNLAGVVAAAFGGSRKCLVLDLDNTLWGGVIGDDGLGGIKLGQGTPEGEAHADLHAYAKALKERGVILAVSSKNEDAAAREGLGHPDSLLKPGDFAAFKANWDPKPANLAALARELDLGVDSLVFLDDNPAERAGVRGQLPAVAVPEPGEEASGYVDTLDRAGHFETLALSGDDLKRAGQYALRAGLAQAQAQFEDNDAFLRHLDMRAAIAPFEPLYFDRIAQLINKSNQFNLTTRRYTLSEVQDAAANPGLVTRYGRLADRYGDHGLVAVTIGAERGDGLDLDLWLMSCRVLKRGMEYAMLAAVAAAARGRGLKRLRGLYLPTAKNALVRDLYLDLGFTLTGRDPDGTARYEFDLSAGAVPAHFIRTEAGG